MGGLENLTLRNISACYLALVQHSKQTCAIRFLLHQYIVNGQVPGRFSLNYISWYHARYLITDKDDILNTCAVLVDSKLNLDLIK